jgi:hypothetical protein
MEKKVVKMEKILVKMEKMEKMEKIIVILEKIIVWIQVLRVEVPWGIWLPVLYEVVNAPYSDVATIRIKNKILDRTDAHC